MTSVSATPREAIRFPRRIVAIVVVACGALTGCTGTPKALTPPTSPATTASAATTTSTTTTSTTTTAPTPPPASKHPHTVSFTSAWRWALPGPGVANSRQVGGIAQDATRVYVAVSSDNPDTKGALYALSISTGRALWKVTLPGSPTAEPVVIGAHVLIDSETSTREDLYGVDAATGRLAWRHADITPGNLVGPFAVRIGAAAFVSDEVGKKAYVTRLDPATGKVTARHATKGGVVSAAGTKILIDDGFHLSSYPVALNRPDWTVTSAGSLAYDLYADSTIVSTVDDEPSGSLTGFDPTSGRRLWHRAIKDSNQVTFSAAGTNVYFTDFDCSKLCSMTAVTARTGAIRWKSFDTRDTADYAAPDVATDGLLLCGVNLLSVNAVSGALYKNVARTADSDCSGPLLRTDDQAGTKSPHHVLTFAEGEVRSYGTTTANDPPVRTDQNGGWGNVDPKQCQVNPTTTAAALKTALGGTWVLTSADELGTCFWSRGRNDEGLSVSTSPVGSAASARAFLNPKNQFGGCVQSGYITGSRFGTVPAAGLPAGSALCYFTRGYFLGDKTPDRVTGVTRAHTGRYVSVDVFGFPWGTVTTPASLADMHKLLTRLTE